MLVLSADFRPRIFYASGSRILGGSQGIEIRWSENDGFFNFYNAVFFALKVGAIGSFLRLQLRWINILQWNVNQVLIALLVGVWFFL